ncbi:nucleic acid/nucleotide deaminase domain-containing protein [Streptomyces sp. NPDC058726]|uniref:nucleic acid/nucleotide deaminase domain-containing protein n=1 Tax=Streptomyces sp. NPDC058726 TaxID=3346611 RepID=UPI0036AECFF3
MLGQEVATASEEWQQEIAAQAVQRNVILLENRYATEALATGARALGEMLAQSWIADHLTRWQDYWSPGGPGWIGDSPMTIRAHSAPSKCLQIADRSNADGALSQIYTCNGGTQQKWQIEGGALVNVNSGKCLGVKHDGVSNSYRVKQWTCGQYRTQEWEYTTHGTTQLRNRGSGECLELQRLVDFGDAWLSPCNSTNTQKFDIVPDGHNGTDNLDYPTQAQFAQATRGITSARTEAEDQLVTILVQTVIADVGTNRSERQLADAYALADREGFPRGRGLLVGQQKAQVTAASAAALNAMHKAGETALAATRASAGDSATIAARAVTQAAGTRAAFRTAAAEAAKEQAKASAEAAAIQAGRAKAARDTAKTKLTETKKAEADAKAAAATAHAKRLAAEKEEATAKAEKETAAQKQAEAAQHKTKAQEYATQAKDAKDRAETAETTATEKRKGAETARDEAKKLRDDAWDAEQKANATRAKADAKEAYAQAAEADDNAQEARKAADEADAAADDAETAATSARSEADKATQAAADADAAATRAEAAAKGARANADDAQAAKLKSDAAVKTATSAAADAIKAAKASATAARTAVEHADDADRHAADAKKQADAAKTEAATALKGANEAAGHAYTTSKAAVDAGNSAARVAAPANDAIQLGSPYITSDSAAGLAVLTGQSSKTIAEQQQAVAEAHAANAQKAAAQAESVANAASGDAKAAYTLAAEALGYAADARGSAKEALGYSAEAASYAAQATQSLTRTIAHNTQATEDATAADRAAGRAEGHAEDARDSADEAALDAEAARTAATEAEGAAEDARDAADQAAIEAAAAEEAAKDAQEYAESAQEAADRAEKAANAEQIETGTVVDAAGVPIGNVFYVIDRIEKVGDPQVLSKTDGCDGWIDELFYNGDCTITSKIRFKADLDLYMCTAEDLDTTQYTCPSGATVHLGEYPTEEMSTEVTHTITIAEYQKDVDPIDILFGSWIRCAQKIAPGGSPGSLSGCAWAAVDVASLFAGKIIRPIADAVTAMDAAARTGIGFLDAWKALGVLRIPEAAMAGIASRVAQKYHAACRKIPSATRTAPMGSIGNPVSEYSCDGLIPYNSTELANAAYRARIDAGFGVFGNRNVAVARVPGWNDPKTGDLVIGFSKGGGFHTEDDILEQLAKREVSPKRITALYSERQPCPVCGPNLENLLSEGTEITWSVQWGSNRLMNRAFEDILASMIQQQGRP